MTARRFQSAGWAFVCLALCGCPRQAVRGDTDDPIGVEIFRHADHLGDQPKILKRNAGKPLVCGDCHASTAATGWVAQRPGSDNHAPCDGCHAGAYKKPPNDYCKVCHTSVDPMHAGKSPLGEYPRRARTAELIGAFNHALHLTGKSVKKDGKSLDCGDCHQVKDADAAYASFPTHANCAPCHAPEAAANREPRLDRCGGCHDHAGPGRARAFVKNDIRFTHGKHRVDQGGKAIECRVCHGTVAESTTAAEVVLPRMASCATCHEDATRTPDRVRLSQCGVCHQDDVESNPLPGNHTAGGPAPLEGLAALQAQGYVVLAQAAGGPPPTATDAVPRLIDLLPRLEPEAAAPSTIAPAAPAGLVHAAPPLTPQVKAVNPNVKPEDHSPLFRVRHESAARSADAKCGYCHEGLSGSNRDSCNDCHAVSEPRSHTLRFRSVSHGRAAARDPQACATCHEVDTCTACHAQRPPSHGADFRARHDRAAAFNPRACMTCHNFESTCVECHNGAWDPAGAATNALRRSPR